MPRLTIKGNEFYKNIGGARPTKKPQPKGEHNFVKKVYCSNCLTTHEEGRHIHKGGDKNAC